MIYDRTIMEAQIHNPAMNTSIHEQYLCRSKRPHHRFAVPLPRCGEGGLEFRQLGFPRKSGGSGTPKA